MAPYERMFTVDQRERIYSEFNGAEISVEMSVCITAFYNYFTEFSMEIVN